MAKKLKKLKKSAGLSDAEQKQTTASHDNVSTVHPEYTKHLKAWSRIRDCLDGEDTIKNKNETYLPRPAGMSGEYADAYKAYIERAHFPLIVSYALAGALGIVITKLPEFHMPKEMEYLLKHATKDGRSLSQLFLDTIIEIFQTGKCPLLLDIVAEQNQFRFVQYKAEEFINWKTSDSGEESNLTLGVIKERVASTGDIYSHDTKEVYRVLYLNSKGEYSTQLVDEEGIVTVKSQKTPTYLGTPFKEIPLFMAGSINNSYGAQPIPLVSVANCSVQIYRKEADLANSEFLSCNPTLVLVGASNEDDLPNVVGSSVMMVIPNDQARVFYTETDTAALEHVSNHIKDLYEEAIRHGVAILDARKGVEAAEALRIRQATQSASIYSIYLSAMNAILKGLKSVAKWQGLNPDKVKADAPTTLTQGIPDSSVLKAVVEGFGQGVIPLPIIHKYLVDAGLVDPTISYDDYLAMLKKKDYEGLSKPFEKEDDGSSNNKGANSEG
jgi:hypothetical protein